MSRTESRRMAFELLYSFEVQKLDIAEQKEQTEFYIENNEIQDQKVIEYLEDAINGINENKEDIVKNISDNLAKNWQLDRVYKINIAILKLAIYEILYKKLPYKVVINEAVELAKAYGDDSSSSFVNGVLANIVKDIEE